MHGVAKTAEKEDAWLHMARKWYDIGQSEEGNLAYIPLEYMLLISGNKSLSRKEKIENYTSVVKKLGVSLSYHPLDE